MVATRTIEAAKRSIASTSSSMWLNICLKQGYIASSLRPSSTPTISNTSSKNTYLEAPRKHLKVINIGSR